MKKGRNIMLTVFLLLVALILGVFIGRNYPNSSITLTENTLSQGSTAATVSQIERLNINTASQRQLANLPGIGEILAGRIIDYRTQNGPFASTDELLQVEGIGEKKLKGIEHLIKAGE